MNPLRSVMIVLFFLVYFTSTGQSTHETNSVTFEKLFFKGKEYQLLSQMTGNWEVQMKLWVSPDASPIIAPLFYAKRTMVGNFLQEVGQFRSKTDTFTRIAYFSYNAIQQQWETVVLDTRYPLMMFETSMSGVEESSNMITFFMTAFVRPPFLAAKAGQLTKLRQTLMLEKDKNIIKQYWTPAGEKEFLAIEYEYKRVK